MANFSASQNFATTGGAAGYRLDVNVVTTEVSGGTQLYVTASATRIRFDLSPAFSSSGSRSYSVPGGRTNSTSGSLLETGSATWSYDFRNSSTQTVWGGFYRYIPYGATSTTVSITAAGSGSSFLLSTTASVNVTLFQQVQTVTVPNLLGSNYVSAYNTITSLGLSSNLLGTDSTSNAGLADTVSYQTPGGGTVVNVGSTVSWKYYVYTAPTYTVSYNANGGSVSPTSASVQYPGSVTLPTPSRSGYTLNGWYTSPSGGSYVGFAGNSYQPSSNITLYAQWSAIQYTISFEENGGSTVSNITGNVNSTVTLPTSTRSGFTFGGWFSNAALTNGPYTSWTITANQTLYAKWTSLAPGFTDETISQSLLLNQDFSTAADRTVSATNTVSFEIVYAGSNLSPTSWLSINNSGQLSGSTNIAGVYSFIINAVNSQGDKTPSGIKTLTISYPGKRFDATLGTGNLTNARRYDGVNWIPIVSMKRFDGTNWIDITN